MTAIGQAISDALSSLSTFMDWETTKSLANSAFTTSLVGAAAGAVAGALGAQKIAERSKLREELLVEIRNTNAAIALTFEVCNTLLGLKKQHVKDLKENYDKKKAELSEYMRRRDTGEILPPFQFEADLMTLTAPSLPIDVLQAIVFERLSVVGRPLNLITTLARTADDLARSSEKRNALIESYKAKFADDMQQLVPLYLGMPFGGGHVNLEYPHVVDGIYEQTDSGIYFAYLLSRDLHDHGNRLAEKFAKKFKQAAPRISEVDFGSAAKEGLMPDEAKFADWTKAFVRAEKVA